MRHLYLICTWSACSSWTAWNQNKWLSLLKHWPSKLPEPLVEAQFPAKSARVSGSGWKRAWNGLIQSIWCFLCCQCNASETFCQNCQFLVLTEDPLSKGASYWTMRQWPDDMAGIPSNLRHDRWAFSFLLVGPDSYYTLLRKYSWINLFLVLPILLFPFCPTIFSDVHVSSKADPVSRRDCWLLLLPMLGWCQVFPAKLLSGTEYPILQT